VTRALLLLGVGRRSRWAVLGAWIALVAVLGPLGLQLPDLTNDEFVMPGGTQTSEVRRLLRERFPGGEQRPVLLVYRREGGLETSDRARIAEDARLAAEAPLAGEPIPAFAPGSPPELVSAGGEVAITVVPLESGEVIHTTPSIEALRELEEGQPPGLELSVTGFPAIQSDYNSAIKEADVTLLLATGALVLVLLLAVYRSPVLALLPLVVVGLAYSVATGVIYLLAEAGLPVDSTSTSLVLVLMFGAGTDYCLLLVARYRSALRHGAEGPDALRAAIPNAAPAMIASGLTVIAALVVMLTAIFGVNRTLGPVNAIGVAVVLLASLTLLPALLAVLGPRVFWPRHGAAAEQEGWQERLWRSLGARVRRAPAVWLVASVLLLGAGALGLLVYEPDVNPVAQFREETDATEGVDALRSGFPAGALAPTTALVERVDGRVTEADLAAVRGPLGAEPGVAAVTDTGRRSQDGRLAALAVTFADDPFLEPALERVDRLRGDVGALAPELRVVLGEGSGERLDFKRAATRDLKVVIPLVLLVVFATLVVLLRALVAPLYLLATVILSFVGTLGASLFIFRVVFDQEGFDPAIPLIVFIFLVALGADYNIFLMSRVREEALRHGTDQGMLRALVATGPVITSAGLILAGTFSVLMVLPIWDLFEIGFAVAFGVLVDTFVVRSVVVPAITWLLQERAWWPSTAEAGRRSTLVSGVYTTRELLGVDPEQS
jgi:RND superfamily putative drug exporter